MRRTPTPLFGRTRLRDQLSADRPRNPRLCLVAGEMGVGKTRLVTETARRAARRGALVLWGSGVEVEGKNPYGVLTEAFDGFLSSSEPQVREVLAAQYPGVCRLLPAADLAPAGPSTPEERRSSLFADAADMLRDLAAVHPLFVVLDDLHLADEGSLLLLHHLVRRAAGTRVRFAATLRDSESSTRDLAGFLDSVGRLSLAHRVDLTRLERYDCDQLVTAIVTDSAAEPELLDRIYALSLGNPLFVHELASGYATDHSAPRPAAEESDAPLPARLSDLAAERVDRQPSTVRLLLDLLAVAGAESSLDELADAAAALDTGLDHEDLRRALDRAVAARLVDETARRGSAGYAFHHPLPRLAVYQRLPAARRVQLHQVFAEVVERRRPDDIDALAFHFTEADHERAAHYLLRAGDRARDLYANGAAQEYYRQFVEREERHGHAAAAAQARLSWGQVLSTLGRYGDALDALGVALEFYERAGDAGGRLRAATEIGHVHSVAATPTEGLAVLEPLVGTGDVAANARACIAMARLCFRAGLYTKQVEAAERAVELGRTIPDPDGTGLVAHGLAGRAVGLIFTGRHEHARADLEAAVPLAERAGDPPVLTTVLSNLSDVQRSAGELTAARAYRRRTLALAERTGDPSTIAFELANVAALNMLIGRWDEAFAQAGEAAQAGRAVGSSTLPYTLVGLAEMYLRLGWRADAVRTADECLAAAEGSGDAQAVHHAQAMRAEIAIELGEPHTAVALLGGAGGLPLEYTDRRPALLARAYLEAGDLPAAQAAARRCAEWAARTGDRLVHAEANWILGLALGRTGDPAEREQAVTLLRAAEAATVAMPYPYLASRIRAALGEVVPAPELVAAAEGELAELRAMVDQVTGW